MLRALIGILGVGLCLPVSASACLKPGLLERASEDRRAALLVLDEDCRLGLALMRAAKPAQALAHLERAWQGRSQLAEPLALPLAEAMYGAGLPMSETLVAWERVDEPVGLVSARRFEIVERLRVGQAETLLETAPKRPAAALLAARAQADRAAPAGDAVAKPERRGLGGRIGVMLPLSGRLGRIGRRLLAGLRLGLGPSDTLLVRDSASGRAPSVLVAELVAAGVLAIVGPVQRHEAAAAARAADKREVPLLQMSVAQDELARREWVFRAAASPRSELRRLVAEARQRGARRFAVAGPGTPFRLALAAQFKAEVRAAGGRLVHDLEYKKGARVLTTVARELRRHRFDVLFIADNASGAGTLLRFLAREDIWVRHGQPRPPAASKLRYVRVLGPGEWLRTGVASDDRRYFDGVWVAPEWHPGTDKQVRRFEKRALTAFGRAPGLFEALGFDAMLAIAQSRAQSRAALRDALRAQTFLGLLGRTHFSATGEPLREVHLLGFRQGRFLPLPP